MMASVVAFTHAMWIANEEDTHPLLLAEGDNFPGSLVAQVADLAPFAGADLVAGFCELPPAPRSPLAPFALFVQAPQGHVMSPFERADAPSRDDQRCTCIGGDSSLVNLSKVYCRLHGDR
jgi:hypothetical protein